MGCGVEAERLGEEKCAPVCDAANDAEAGEDQRAGCACDSGEERVLVEELGMILVRR